MSHNRIEDTEIIDVLSQMPDLVRKISLLMHSVTLISLMHIKYESVCWMLLYQSVECYCPYIIYCTIGLLSVITRVLYVSNKDVMYVIKM